MLHCVQHDKEGAQYDKEGVQPDQGSFSAGLWASPTSSWAGALDSWSALLANNARLAVVAPGGLARNLTGGLGHAAAGAGFRITSRQRIGSPRSLVAAAMVRFARTMRRPDLADRAEAAFRLSLRPRSHALPALCELLLLTRDRR